MSLVKGSHGCGREYESLSGTIHTCDSYNVDLGFTGLCEDCEATWLQQEQAAFLADYGAARLRSELAYAQWERSQFGRELTDDERLRDAGR